MVDVVHDGLGVNQTDEVLHNGNDVVSGQYPLIQARIGTQFLVNPVAAHLAQVVALVAEEQALDHVAGGLLVGCLGVP